MRCQHQIQRRIRQCRTGHHAVGSEEEPTTSLIREAHPADILAVSHRLGLGEINELVGDSAFVTLDILARLAVAVVIDRATSVVRVAIVALGQDEFIAEARKRKARLVRRQAGAELDTSVGVHCPDRLR